MLSEIVPYLIGAIPMILLGSIVLAVIYFSRLPRAFKVLLAYLFWNLLVEGITFLLPYGTNNLPLLHIHTLIEFVLFTLLYRETRILDFLERDGFWVFILIISGLIVLNSLFLQDIFSYNSYAKTLVNTLLIAYALIYFFGMLGKTEVDEPFLWVNSAVLIQYTASLFVFMFSNVSVSDTIFNLIWDMNMVINFLFQILIFIAIWKVAKPPIARLFP